MPYTPPDWLAMGCALVVGGEKVAIIQGFECIYKVLLNLIVTFAGIALFAMIVVGSFKWLTSAGDTKTIESARNTITYGIGGLFLLVLSWFILQLVQNFTGADVTQFIIPR